ncbi:hypothetical protein NHF50_10025 [Flavobacterium sp. NRK F10]|uniref:DUF7832 domain-containing protein n=1 Tax=Flavobacterium sp. NRK F10 TaxID=2954931 RepID=UPI002091C244|nr:hypothetical protein [Flavobacterium sp. NRK F10]MCO6175380.1 hypothetical protein [Flavobacterium sp. NRK F10]
MITYDRIDWHTGSNYPKELPFQNGGTHIGMFLTWIINNNLISSMHLENSKKSIEKVKAREMTGTQFLIKECDGKLWSEDLNKEGNSFAHFYYANEKDYGQYIDDYANVFNKYETLFHVEDNWGNYEKIEPVITKMYNEWKQKISS